MSDFNWVSGFPTEPGIKVGEFKNGSIWKVSVDGNGGITYHCSGVPCESANIVRYFDYEPPREPLPDKAYRFLCVHKKTKMFGTGRYEMHTAERKGGFVILWENSTIALKYSSVECLRHVEITDMELFDDEDSPVTTDEVEGLRAIVDTQRERIAELGGQLAEIVKEHDELATELSDTKAVGDRMRVQLVEYGKCLSSDEDADKVPVISELDALRGDVKLLTRQLLANLAASRWKKNYRNDNGEWRSNISGPCEVVYEKLIALGETPNPDDVDAAIGNGSWTTTVRDVSRLIREGIIFQNKG